MEFTLTKWSVDYIESIAKNGNNENIAKFLRNGFPFPYEYKDAEKYIKGCIDKSDEGQYCRAIVVNGEAVGSIGIFLGSDIYCKSAELGYWLGEPFWGNGIMTSAIKQLCKEAFSQFDIERIYAEPFAHNIGSRKTLEKAGFILEGIMKNSVFKQGKLYDFCMYALLKME